MFKKKARENKKFIATVYPSGWYLHILQVCEVLFTTLKGEWGMHMYKKFTQGSLISPHFGRFIIRITALTSNKNLKYDLCCPLQISPHRRWTISPSSGQLCPHGWFHPALEWNSPGLNSHTIRHVFYSNPKSIQMGSSLTQDIKSFVQAAFIPPSLLW